MRPDSALARFLVAHGLAGEDESAILHPLTGGVSSDIWRVDLPGRSICVKRALPKLKVQADWHAPVDRNAYEWAWLNFAARAVPDNVPHPLAQDAEAGLFAMSYLDPADHPVWKQQLMAGKIDAATASQVGRVLGLLHASSADNEQLAREFDSGENFYALRLEPYLVECSRKHPSVAAQLIALVDRTATTRRALVHGDVSPKNILVGPKGPVLLDAECAWYGDPAFDVAFCLNHLLLKSIPVPTGDASLRRAFQAFVEAYFAHVDWEPADDLDRRAAALLPGLLLARADGKSPVEYLRGSEDRERIRMVALPLLERDSSHLTDVAERWFSTAPAR